MKCWVFQPWLLDEMSATSLRTVLHCLPSSEDGHYGPFFAPVSFTFIAMAFPLFSLFSPRKVLIPEKISPKAFFFFSVHAQIGFDHFPLVSPIAILETPSLFSPSLVPFALKRAKFQSPGSLFLFLSVLPQVQAMPPFLFDLHLPLS